MPRRCWKGLIWLVVMLVFNPIVPGFKLDKDSAGMAVDSPLYMQMVGSLMYLTSTKPDIMFVVSLLSRY